MRDQREKRHLCSSSSYYYYYYVITFMRCFYNYMFQRSNVSRVYSAGAVLYLQFVLYVMLHPILNVSSFYIRTFRSMCAVPSMAVVCIFPISCFPVYSERFCDDTVCYYYYWYHVCFRTHTLLLLLLLLLLLYPSFVEKQKKSAFQELDNFHLLTRE